MSGFSWIEIGQVLCDLTAAACLAWYLGERIAKSVEKRDDMRPAQESSNIESPDVGEVLQESFEPVTTPLSNAWRIIYDRLRGWFDPLGTVLAYSVIFLVGVVCLVVASLLTSLFLPVAVVRLILSPKDLRLKAFAIFGTLGIGLGTWEFFELGQKLRTILVGGPAVG